MTGSILANPMPAWRRRMPGCGLVLLALIALLTIAALVLYSLYHAVPPGYRRVMQRRALASPLQRYAVAESLQHQISREITFTSHFDDHGRPLPDASDTRLIPIPADPINDWLDQMAHLWLRNRDITLPATVTDLAFWTRGQDFRLAARVQRGDFDHLVTASLRITIPPDGSDALLQLTGLQLGRLPVPLALIRDIHPDADRLIAGYPFPATQSIGGQSARWLAIRPAEDGLVLEIRREAEHSSQETGVRSQ